MSSKIKTISIVVISCMLASANIAVYSADKDSTLKIYLLREVAIEDKIPNLGQVSIIRGAESLIVRASKITLGRISVPGQELVVDRSMVLSRLACNGIPASSVTLTGAEKILVKQRQQIVKGDEFVEQASSFLKKNLPGASVCQWSPMRIPKDLVIPPDVRDIKFARRLAKSGIKNQAKVQIIVLCGGKEVGMREVAFRLKYSCRKAVTRVDIPQGAVISSENVKIEKTVSNYAEPVNWTAPYGLVAMRRMPANTVIRANMVGPVKSEIIVKRNQNVVVRLASGGLFLTTSGKALGKGRAGDYVKVRVQITKRSRTIMAKINEDGTVEPIL